jgi:hypothetical protein
MSQVKTPTASNSGSGSSSATQCAVNFLVILSLAAILLWL